MTSKCFDCRRPYGDAHGFPDLIIPFWAWKQISPTGDEGGLLCPSCICARLHDRRIRCEGAFTSGPIISVSEPTINALRRVENIELAIEGRQNQMSGIREVLGPEATYAHPNPGDRGGGRAENNEGDTLEGWVADPAARGAAEAGGE